MLNINLEQQQQVRGADGSILWSGGQAIANSGIVSVAAGKNGFLAGEAFIVDATNTVVPRLETTIPPATPPTDLPMSFALFGERTPAAAGNRLMLGVVQEGAGTAGVALTTARRVLVAMGGSICAVITTATTLTLGDSVGSSVTAGAVSFNAVTVTGGGHLGVVIKANIVGATGTGSTGWAGIIVRGGSMAIS